MHIPKCTRSKLQTKAVFFSFLLLVGNKTKKMHKNYVLRPFVGSGQAWRLKNLQQNCASSPIWKKTIVAFFGKRLRMCIIRDNKKEKFKAGHVEP